MSDRHGQVTLQQVAAKAKVSLATASRAINGSARKVNPELADRVMRAAQELNYTVNAQAQAMVRGHTNVIGLVVGDIVDPYFGGIASGLMDSAESEGLLVTLAATRRQSDRERDHLTNFAAQRARAVVIVGSRSTDESTWSEMSERISAFEAAGGRVVNVGQPLLACDTVVIANRLGAAEMARELMSLGHTKFGILAGAPTLITPKDRAEGFRDAVVEAGHPEPVVVEGAFTRDGGLAAMAELLDRKTDVTCVFATADALAFGAMTACRQRGVRIPDDLSIAGFDDVPGLIDLHPHLTTYRLPLERIGREALRLAVDSGAEGHRQLEIVGEVVMRDSTRPLTDGDLTGE